MAPNPTSSVFDEDAVCKKDRDEKPCLQNLNSGKFGQTRKVANPLLESLGAPHVGSFNYMLDQGINYAVQVWPLTQFFLFPFYENSLICLEGKSMTPHLGNTILFRSSQQLPRLRLGPSKGFLS